MSNPYAQFWKETGINPFRERVDELARRMKEREVETSDARKRRIEEAREGAPFEPGDRVVHLPQGVMASRGTGRVTRSGSGFTHVEWDAGYAVTVHNSYLRRETSDEALKRLRKVLAGDSGVETPVYDAVQKPEHYTHSDIEVWDAIRAWKLNYFKGAAVKYIARAGRKDNEAQDIEKAIAYLTKELENLRQAAA